MAKSDHLLISEEYRAQLQEKHGSDDEWGSTGAGHYDTIMALVDAFGIKSILDYGCGKGTVGQKFREDQNRAGIHFYEYDPGIEGKNDPATKAELLINTDVLEHIEPHLVDNVLADMAARTQRVAFFVISCSPALHVLPDGRNAHLIIEKPEWWIRKLSKYFTLTQAECVKNELYIIALARQDTNAAPSARAEKSLATARAYINVKNYTLARAALEDAQDAQTGLLEAQIAYETEDFAAAAQLSHDHNRNHSDPDAQRLLGLSLCQLGRHGEALKSFDNSVCRVAFADDGEYVAALMKCWNQTFQPASSIAFYNRLQSTDPRVIDEYVRAMTINQDYQGACAAAEHFVKEFPDEHMLWAVLCRTYDANRLFDKALPAALKCVELAPENSAYHSNLGLAYLHLGRLEDAGRAFDQAIAIDPNLTAAHVNRASIYRLQENYAAEEAQLRTCLEIDPVMADAQYGLGISLMHQEKYFEGFAAAEWYWHKNTLNVTRLPLSFRRWYGEPLHDKILLIYADQGVGDTLMMARYIDLILKTRGVKGILLNVNVKLRGLFQHQFRNEIAAGTVVVFTEQVENPIKGVDFAVAASSLPHAMDTRIDTVPASAGYLTARDAIDYKTPDKPFVIGISWYTKSMDSGIYRSLKLMDFAFLGKIPGVRIVNLQYGDTSAERADAAAQGFEILHDDKIDVWNDLQAATDQIAACDLVISIDNTTVHTAGALGKPTWVILPKECYWRWPVAGDSTPWYDSIRIFRQKAGQPYTDLIPQIETALTKYLAGDDSQRAAPAFKPLFAHAKPAKTALIINDTQGCYSWGNYASLSGIKDTLSGRGYDIRVCHTLELQYFAEKLPSLTQFDDPVFVSQCRYRDPTLFHHLQHADAVVINGEGMMNRLSEPAIQMLYLAYVARMGYGRKVSLINFSCFPEGGTQLSDPKILSYYLKGLKAMTACRPREGTTQALLRSIGIPAELAYDPAVLTLDNYLKNNAAPARTKNVVITAGPGYDSQYAPAFAKLCKDLASSGFTPVILYGAQWQTAQEDLTLASDLRNLDTPGVEYRKCTGFNDFMETLLGARMVISGFYSNIILAHAAGIPVIPFTHGGNAVALAGLAKSYDLPAPLQYSEAGIDKTLTKTIKNVLSQRDSKKTHAESRLADLCAMALKNFDSF